MTAKFTISLPDDLAEVVRSGGNASGYIAEAVRMRQRLEATQVALAAVGVHDVPREEYERIARSVAESDARRSDPDRRRVLDARLDELARRRR
ncbi:hypothetical protein ACFQY4_13450 [Catellatospora bangladeshensis]|uniref:Uncharacterized protein n=1 Tax=Catellatospora bangladeshensis TaxID=310355 RepID=A0A8J3JXP0_9ACTN|nr:hypothetical protein [Catellatospora bangladeshensis]GIF84984.1 hypothetical protein Cba03nite_63330 [Catellatospora bangladeshensis]